jgi:two-component system cell cycle response regulator
MKVLVADDDLVSRRLLESTLSKSGYRVVVAADGAEALRLLEGPDCPRLAVLDWIMPEENGVEVCRKLREKAQEPYVYVILLTMKGLQDEIIEGLEAGANDYVIKPCDLQELQARVRAGKRILELHDQLVATREQLRVEATHDSLTGCLNRRAVLETLDKEVTRSARQDAAIGVIMLDIDRFKGTNDTYGHLAGDAVLRETSKRMRDSVRSYDTVGRYGGEEFLIVVPGCGMKEIVDLAERLRACVAKEPIRAGQDDIATTISLGVAIRDNELKDSEALLRAADEALYSAKHAGRNRVHSHLQAAV